MRVLYFSRDYTPHDYRFLEALAGTSHEVSYLRLEDDGRSLEQRALPPSIQRIQWWGGDRPLGRSDWPRAGWEVRKVFQQHQPELVHAGPIQSCAFLSATAGFHPLLSMSWGSDLLMEAQSGMGRITARWTLERSDAFACDCEAVRQAALQLGAPKDAICVFPWGVDLEHFSPQGDASLRREFGWEADEVVLLSTRAWEPLYGVTELARAFVRAAQDWPELRLLMLGDGSLAQELNELFQEGAVADRVAMPGQIHYDALPAYYRTADLYISASHSDGSSVSLMEALACGLPAVVSDIAGNKEWVESGVNGWFFPMGRADGLAQALLSVKSRQALLAQFGKASRKVAEARADWPQNFAVLMDAYEAAVEKAS